MESLLCEHRNAIPTEVKEVYHCPDCETDVGISAIKRARENNGNPDSIYPQENHEPAKCPHLTLRAVDNGRLKCETCGYFLASGEYAGQPIIVPSKIPIIEESKEQIGGNHYSRLAVQPFDLIKSMETAGDVFVDYCRATAIKYAVRIKGDRATLIDDLRKGAHYLTEAANRLEGMGK